MEWKNDKYIYGSYKLGINKNKTSDKVAAFDLDGTLICTKSGKDFAKDSNDWKLFSDNVKEKLENYYEGGYRVVIISNQKGISKGKVDPDEWMEKLNAVSKEINVPIEVFASKCNDIYRKPFPTFWKIIAPAMDRASSFYCGDAAGRSGDHSDTDLKFALNVKVKFYTPEKFFIGEDNKSVLAHYPIDLTSINKETSHYKFKANEEGKEGEIIIMTGWPGSGKSTFVKEHVVPAGYELINRDTLKTSAKCLKKCEEIMKMKNGKNIVVDNTNPDAVTRKKYLDLAKKYKYCARSIEMATSRELSEHNAHYRHMVTNGKIDLIPTVAYRLYKGKYKAPSIIEGFSIIEKVDFNFSLPSKAELDDYKMYFY